MVISLIKAIFTDKDVHGTTIHAFVSAFPSFISRRIEFSSWYSTLTSNTKGGDEVTVANIRKTKRNPTTVRLSSFAVATDPRMNQSKNMYCVCVFKNQD